MVRMYSITSALVILLFVGYSFTYAQNSPIDKGGITIGGSFSFSSDGGDLHEVDDSRTTYTSMNSGAAYFISPGLAVGSDLVLVRATTKYYSRTVWSAGPKITLFPGGGKTKETIKGTVHPYVGSGYMYSRRKYDDDDPDSGGFEQAALGSSVFLTGGAIYMLSNTIGIFGEAIYQLDRMKFESRSAERGNRFGINIGIIGFIY